MTRNLNSLNPVSACVLKQADKLAKMQILISEQCNNNDLFSSTHLNDAWANECV